MVHESLVEAVALSGDDLFATGTTQGNVRIWKRLSAGLPRGKVSNKDNVPKQQEKRIVAISPDRKSKIVSVGSYRSQEFSIRISGKENHISPPRQWDAFRSAEFSREGKLLLLTGASGLDGSTRGASEEGAIILQLSDQKQIGAIMSHQNCWWAGFDPLGKTIATVGDGFVQIWSAEAQHTRSTRLVHDGVMQVIWNPVQPSRLVSISPNDSVRLWNAESGALIREVEWPVEVDPETGDPFVSTGFDIEGRRFFTLSRSGAMVWDAATLEALCDPFVIRDIPLAPDWAFIDDKLGWRKIDLSANAPLRETVLAAADFIAGIRIGDDGSKQTIAYQLELVEPLMERILALGNNPEAKTLRSLASDAFLLRMAAIPQAQIETALTWSEKLISLQDAVYNFTSPPRGSTGWVLNRDRLSDFQEVLDGARVVDPVESDRLMKLLLDQWQKREDAAAVLTRWHFGQRTDENRRLALASLEEVMKEVDADEEPVSRWIQEWKEELR
jgi:WD40 repeat protein